MRPGDAKGGIPGQTGLAATEIGDAVHVLLEHGVAADAVREPVLARYPAATERTLPAWPSSCRLGMDRLSRRA